MRRVQNHSKPVQYVAHSVLSVDVKGSIVPALEATLEELREAVIGDQTHLLDLSAKKQRAEGLYYRTNLAEPFLNSIASGCIRDTRRQRNRARTHAPSLEKARERLCH